MTYSAARLSPEALAREAAAAFSEMFGRPAERAVVAPGRVNLIGEHTDYNGGFVLPMAIERSIAIVAASSPDSPGSSPGGHVRIHSAAIGATVDLALGAPMRAGSPHWSNYIRGVIAGFQRRGAHIPSFDAFIASDLPMGGGLASSAALEVAAATLFEAASGTLLAPVEKAHLCQRAEHEFAGVPCGLMDPLISTLADEHGPLLIDCRSEIARSVPLGPNVSILIANSNVPRALADGGYARRNAECENAARTLGVESLRDATLAMVDAAQGALGPVLHRRARHVVTENARTLEATRAFEASDFARAGELFYESHRSLRDDYEVSCNELDILVDSAREIGQQGGVFGARMTGGGFGGCTVILASSEAVGSVSEELHRRYERQTGRKLDVFASRPARGARRLEPRDFT